MSHLAFAAHMLVLAHICHGFSHVQVSADRCLRINHIFGVLVRILTQVVPLQADEVVGDEITETPDRGWMSQFIPELSHI